MSNLTDQFNEAMLSIYRRAKAEAHYNARLFLEMVLARGGLETAKALINSNKPSSGYTNLFERGRLDLTVEAMVLEDPRWQNLFTEVELKKARRRLSDFGYRSATRSAGKHG